MSPDDTLRAAGLLDLGDEPTTEAVASALRRLGELAQGSDAATLAALRAGAWRVLEPLRVDAADLDAALGRRNGAAPAEPVVVRLADVEPVSVSWLWPGRIPLGRLTILDGDPGLGKSTVTLDLVARVTRGDRLPDGSLGLLGPRGVVLLGAEDGLADTVRPRLDAAGADCTRVYALTGVRDSDGRPRLPTVADVHAIRAAAKRVGAALLIIDPLSAYMGAGVDGHRDIDVRTALAGLAALAEATGLAILLVRHLSKSGGANPLYRGGGSIAYIAAARSGLLLAADPDDATRRVLAATKSNLAAPQPSLALRLDTVGSVVRVRWLGVSERSARDLLTTEEDGERSARAEAEELLRAELADGPRPVSELRSAARDAGVSLRTLRRAQAALGITPTRVGFGPGGGWSWSLPATRPETPDTIGVHAPESDTPAEGVGAYADAAYLRHSQAPGDSIGVQGRVLDTYEGQEPGSDPGDGPRCDTCECPIGPTATRCAACRYGGDE